MNENEKDYFDAVVISGGGVKGILALGALQYYYEQEMFEPNKTKIYSGTSIGCVINLLLACGYKPMEIFMEIYKKDSFIDAGDLNCISDIIKHMGLIPINVIMKDITKLVSKKYATIPTLIELKEKTGQTLISTATNVTKMKIEYYDYISEPNLNCIDAVEMSCNLPPICQRIKYKGDYIVDGAFMDNFPHKHIDDGKMKILAIVTTGADFSRSDEDFTGYFYRLAMSASVANMNLRCEMVGENTTLVKIEWDVPQDSPMNVFRFSMKHQEKMDMFLRGYKSAELKNTSELLYIPGWEGL